jgi:hypothetical protein
MPALVAGIHVLASAENQGVDGRVKPGHVGWREPTRLLPDQF